MLDQLPVLAVFLYFEDSIFRHEVEMFVFGDFSSWILFAEFNQANLIILLKCNVFGACFLVAMFNFLGLLYACITDPTMCFAFIFSVLCCIDSIYTLVSFSLVGAA